MQYADPHAAAHSPAADLYAHVQDGQVFQFQHLAQHVGFSLEGAPTKHRKVRRGTAHGLGAAPDRGDEVTQQQVAGQY